MGNRDSMLKSSKIDEKNEVVKETVLPAVAEIKIIRVNGELVVEIRPK